MLYPTDPPTITELVSDAVNQFSKLIRNQVSIARAEMAAKASQAATGMGLLIGGALLLIPPMVLLLMALAAWLVELGLSASLSNLSAGVVGFAISAVLAWVGMTKLKPENLKPKRTIHELERDVAAAKELT
jgi:Putative Actinobacterial Holin-X, holin superfamily III